jgi:CheY-like chemotaxis protein
VTIDDNEFSDRVESVQATMRNGSPFARRRASSEDDSASEMRKNRRVNQRIANTTSGGGGSDIAFATGRPRDPLFYWKQNNLPYDFADNDELRKVRAFTRLLYQTDSIIGSAVDIFSKWPLIGMELSCKDDKLTAFYTDLFGFGEDADDSSLHYDDFLVDIGREYWSVGEAWPFATFNEMLGVWEDEELLQPDDIKVERSPFLKEPRYFIRLPETIRKVLQTRQPTWEYNKLLQAYPELVAYTHENQFMPVSNVLLRQLKFKGDTFNTRGVPLLTRAMRPVMQQEMLNAAMDAIADRMYTPLILVKLGASASDLGTTAPWIPTEDDLADFEEAMDAALAADFRALIYNFAISMEPVFGREQMPDLTPDFERLEDRILQTFGLSRTLLTGASSGETYAADALNRDLITQLLGDYQKLIKRHYRQRALVVAEAQGHFDYDERNGKRYVKMEEILEVDEETGEARIVEQPKLLIPDLHMKTMNLSDEEQERQFLEMLRQGGVPISMKTRTRNLPIVLDDEIDQSQEEAIQLAVAEQETRKRIFQALRDKGLPIPDDLETDFGPMVAQAQTPAAPPQVTPQLGMNPQEISTPNLAPTMQDMQVDPADASSVLVPMPVPMPGVGEEEGARPEESDEQREGMPSAAKLYKRAAIMRELATPAPELLPDEEGNLQPGHEPTGKWAAPGHLGKRRELSIDKDAPMDDRYGDS